jgi:hypothetical protein
MLWSRRRSYNATPKQKVAAFMASRTSTLSTLCTDDGSLPEEHTNDHGDAGFDAGAGPPANLTPKQRINYFGDDAKGFFYDTYQQVCALQLRCRKGANKHQASSNKHLIVPD